MVDVKFFGVELGDQRQNLGFRRRISQAKLQRAHADFFGLPHFRADINLACRVFAYQNDREARLAQPLDAQGSDTRSEFDARLARVPQVERETLADCGHMLHHDQPEALAVRLRRFLDAP